MTKKAKQKELQQELKRIIKKMRRIQKNIAADDQPVAMHEVDALTDLGQRYGKVIEQLAKFKV